MLAAFDKYEVVEMGAAHGNKDLDDLILHLIRDPAFPNNVNDSIGCRQTGHFFCHILIPNFSSNRAYQQNQTYQAGIRLSVEIGTSANLFLFAQMLHSRRVSLPMNIDSPASPHSSAPEPRREIPANSMDGSDPDTVRGFEIILRSMRRTRRKPFHYEESPHRKVSSYCHERAQKICSLVSVCRRRPLFGYGELRALRRCGGRIPRARQFPRWAPRRISHYKTNRRRALDWGSLCCRPRSRTSLHADCGRTHARGRRK